MRDGYIKLYQEQYSSDAFGAVKDAESLAFESDANVQEGGIVRGDDRTGYDVVGDVTVYPSQAPQEAPETGQKAEVTDRRGKQTQARVKVYEPDQAFHGRITLSYDS